jgi:hypothetical protein
MDLIADFAFLLPVTVISDMLGIPEEDREVFFTGSRFGGRLLDSMPRYLTVLSILVWPSKMAQSHTPCNRCVRFATAVKPFKRIELCDRHQAVRPPARKKQPRRYGFGYASKGLDRIGDLIRCHHQVGDPLSRFRAAGVREIGVTPFGQLVSTAVVEPSFNRCQK